MNWITILVGVFLVCQGLYALRCMWIGNRKSPYKTYIPTFLFNKKDLTQKQIDFKNYIYGFIQIAFGIILITAGYKGVW